MNRSIGRALRRLTLATTLIFVAGALVATAANAGTVLILGTSVTGGASSREAQAAVAAGHTVEIATPAQWALKTTADFATYDALILGDPTCGLPSTPYIGAAEANRTVWSPAIDGNIVVIGTDEVFHHFQGGSQLTASAVAFAADAAGKTGLMVSLSCYYHDTAPLTPVLVLDQFGTGFKVSGVGCFNNAHIVATHPALAGLTDASLSNWSCSVHEAISDFPSDFLPLAIARNVGGPGSMTFPDGSFGIPYIVARGEGLRFISNIELTPATDENPVGTTHTVTAAVKENDVPVAGKTVTFTILSGPHVGVTGTAVTDASGVATFTYLGATAGTDTIEASYTDTQGVLQKSNQVKKTWVIRDADISVLKTGPAFAPSGGTVTYVVTVSNGGAANATNVTMTDVLPPGATLVSAVPSQGTCSGTVSCSLGSIANGASATVTIVVTTAPAASGSLVCNTAGATADQPDPNQLNNTSMTCATVTPGTPATLVLTPDPDTNTVDDQHCVTATVRDAFGNPTPNISVRFSVAGSVTTSGTRTTNAAGQAEFCYTGPALPGADVITAYADTDNDNVNDPAPADPEDTANKAWVIPVNMEGCKVTYGGRITAANGDKATFGGNANGNGPKGNENYQDHGPTTDLQVKSIEVQSVTCNTAGTQASIFGTATINGAGTFNFRIDLKDLGEPGTSDTYRIRLSSGYDSGEKVLSGGNVQIH
jgi:uncharacterized repeat protein (TIGR01451 family)